MNKLLRSSVTALALGATLLTTTVPQPALADGRASTRNIILAGAAALLLTGAAINANHRRAAGTQIVGYLRDGSTVYADGHIVDNNGNSWNPADRGLQVACDGERCRIVRNDDESSYNNNEYENGSTTYENAYRYQPRDEYRERYQQRYQNQYQNQYRNQYRNDRQNRYQDDGRHHHHHQNGGRPN